MDPTSAQRPSEGNGSPALTEDRRGAVRLAVDLAAKLAPLRPGNELTCAADNVSAGGAHLRAPVAAGLTVGQRLEVGFDPGAENARQVNLAGESRYATVVRTEPRRYQSESLVGVGLRFDQPLFL